MPSVTHVGKDFKSSVDLCVLVGADVAVEVQVNFTSGRSCCADCDRDWLLRRNESLVLSLSGVRTTDQSAIGSVNRVLRENSFTFRCNT